MNGATILTKFLGDTKDLTEKTKGAENTIGSFAKKAGTVIAGAASAVASASAAIASAFWDGANATAQYGDAIDKTSQKVGMSVEAYQKWDYVMNMAGTSMEATTVGIKTMTAKLDDAINGGVEAQKSFEQLGLTMGDLAGKSREDVFAAVVKQMQGIDDETTKAAIATEFFGRAGQDLLPLLNQSSEEIEQLMQQADDYGIIMSEEAVKASATFDDSLTKLTKTTDGLKNKIMSGFLPGLSQVIDGFSDLIAGSEGAGDAIMAGVQSIADTIQKAIPKIVEAIKTILPILTTVLSDIILTIAQVLMENLPTIIQCGMDVILALILGVIQMIPQLIPTIVECVLVIVQALIDNIDLIIDGAIQLILGLIEGLINAIPILIEAMPKIIMGIVTGLIRNLPKLLLVGPKILLELGKGIVSSMASIIKVGGQIIQGLWKGIKGMKDWVVNKIKDLGKSILNGFKNILGIKSPSKEFAIIGKFSVLGYTEALDDMQDDVQKQIGKTFGINPQVAGSSALHYSPSVNVVNNINMKQDPLGQMVNEIKTFSGGSKNDYNYGMGVS